MSLRIEGEPKNLQILKPTDITTLDLKTIKQFNEFLNDLIMLKEKSNNG